MPATDRARPSIYLDPAPKPIAVKATLYRGRIAPAARFYDYPNQGMVLFFSSQVTEKWGIGTKYRSADLFFVEEDQEVQLKLHQSQHKGQRVVTYTVRPSRARLAITPLVQQFNIGFSVGVWYGVSWDQESETLFIDLSEEGAACRGRGRS